MLELIELTGKGRDIRVQKEVNARGSGVGKVGHYTQKFSSRRLTGAPEGLVPEGCTGGNNKPQQRSRTTISG